ncbi:mechanosensitive ion channel [Panacibacter ginsenosidivorans]|uniref:Mechanosensitive ion channel n=1 Tax=Panacibacter ginsenosidivorans TaxID=1813871 RepID=A0A5B8VFV4_9BACT|nr:mechanosensitive ion channel family protein [Panacibacter ginsenosidivorans]QEC69882.1 mechanosensitive ion channel [Panacibacter ginsenosidivorans]
MKYILIFILLISFSVNAQHSDSLAKDSTHLNEMLLRQQQQQGEIDSLLRLKIQQEINAAVGDAQRTKELEQKLKQIELNDSARHADQLHKLEVLKQTAKPHPVAPFRDTLFNVYLGGSSFSAEERAATITKRIQQLYEDDFFKADSLLLTKNENNYEITYRNELPVMAITELDALWQNIPADKMADDYFNKIKQSIIQEKETNSVANWLKRISMIVLVFVGLAFIIYLINKLFNLVANYFRSNTDKFLNGLTFRKIKLLNAAQYEKLVIRFTNFVRIAIIILALYLALPLLFYIFPGTEDITNTLLNWILTPAKNILSSILAFLPDLFTIIVVYLFTHYLVRALRYFTTEIEAGNISMPGFHKEFARPSFGIIRFLLYAFMLVIIFPYLPGSESPAFQGVSVFLGVLLSLGSSSAVNNIIAGLVITYMRPFKIGDRVKIGDVVGDVIEKTTLVIRIRTIKNEDITVPNSTVLSSNTINYSANALDKGLILHTTVTIGYDAPWKDVQQALINAALRTALIQKEPAPFVLQTSLDDFYVSYQLNAYTKDANAQAVIYSELHKNIQDCFNEAGIEIMSPHYGSLRDGNQTTIPSDYLSKDYKAPAFNIKKEKE